MMTGFRTRPAREVRFAARLVPRFFLVTEGESFRQVVGQEIPIQRLGRRAPKSCEGLRDSTVAVTRLRAPI
jgi:hypothetical protein